MSPTASKTRKRNLTACIVGGTSFLDYLIVLALVGVFVAIGARTIGGHMNSQYRSTTRIFIDQSEGPTTEVSAAVAQPQVSQAAKPDAGFDRMLDDWRRWVDLIVVAPLALLGFAWLVRRRRKKRRARIERRSDQHRRAERLGVRVKDVRSAVANNRSRSAVANAMANEKVAKVVSIH